eukprot:c4113_g1_i1.p1 GENE.c4113_g1_i1~~c4113_g1_i1.p1  ORF type:complete len:470 (-),score=74.51 c4113_g1_i1:47-1327(-)
MVVFPLLMFYLWISIKYYDGRLLLPSSISDVVPTISKFFNHIAVDCFPHIYAAKMYITFCVFEMILFMTMPGPIAKGLPIPSENDRILEYCCNGVWSFYTTCAVAAVLHLTNTWRVTDIYDNFGPILSCAILSGITVSFATYFLTMLFGKPHRMSGSIIYDIFMGAPLNPRLFGGRLDLKLWSEIRVPWVILFFVSVSCACKQYDQYGFVTPQLWFMCLAHWLYVNACMKGEECIPTTWDFFYEKWGFMLIFWNLAGVPFTYCLSSLYIYQKGPEYFQNFSTTYITTLFIVLLFAYYVWDTANSQRVRFRMSLRANFVPRKAFPQLPWGTLKNPESIKTEHGSLLLIGGWWGLARKINYTADLVMALSWGLITGFDSVVPYFYFVFFLIVLTHRTYRDHQRCSKKYGKDWEKYCKRVPYVFIPWVI